MKTRFLKLSALVLVTICIIACSKEENSGITNTTSNTSTTTTLTAVKLTVITQAGVVKPNYIVMMFDQPFSPTQVMPPILKQVSTDATGLAYFDLKTMITSSTPKTYYFEAFVEIPTGYELKSIIRFSTKLQKGVVVTSSIFVN